MPVGNRESELKEWKKKEAEKATLRLELSNPSLKKEIVPEKAPNFWFKLKKIFSILKFKKLASLPAKKEIKKELEPEIYHSKQVHPEPIQKVFYQNPIVKEKPKEEILNLKKSEPPAPVNKIDGHLFSIKIKPEVKTEFKKEIAVKEIKIEPKEEIKKPVLSVPNLQPLKNSFDINLIPENIDALNINKIIIRKFFLILLITLLICGGIYAPLYLEAKNRENTAKELEKITQDVINETKAVRESSQETNNFIDILKEIKKIIEGHIYLEKIFTFLETNTLKTVYYSNLQFNYESGTINLVANAKDYHALAEQILIFQTLGDVIERVDVSSVALEKKEETQDEDLKNKERLVTFNLSLKIKSELLLKK